MGEFARGEGFFRGAVVCAASRADFDEVPFAMPLGDEVYFTRYVRSDGTYWHEVNGRVVPRTEVQRYLRRVGLNPDNMLIIMHQNMVEEFAYLSPKERLRMVEDAIGLGGFRQRIKFALERLEAAKAEEKKVSEMRDIMHYAPTLAMIQAILRKRGVNAGYPRLPFVLPEESLVDKAVAEFKRLGVSF